MFASRLWRTAALVPIVLVGAIVIAVPLDGTAQWVCAGVTILGAIIIKRWKSPRGSLALGILAILVSTRYIVWRTTQTLEFGTLPEFAFGGVLYLAELYAWIILMLGFLQTSFPLERPVIEPEGDPADWPTVDIYIPTYNESLDIVRNTVFAAMDLDYPLERYNVYILDDGKRAEFRAFAKEAGCGYITRDNNLHAKAGNMNAAMKKTDGELIAIFDCDHVPTRAFLQLTIGWFQKDPRLALIQTPHHMYSLDPVQRNLASTMGDMPGEGDLFYGPVQDGNDLWNATFFCGSCAVIRREALEETNGFAGETVTEDAHTALKLQRTGWNTAYISARLSAGLATERLVLHVGQRIRWARGMTQILRIDCPLFGPGLTWQQRLCYLNAMMHFQYPIPRIVFLTSPLAYLIFGQNIIQASASLIFAYAMPHLYCAAVANERTQGQWRAPFWGEVYETILAFHLVKPTVMTWFQPRKGKFNVTDKGSLLDKTYFDWAIVKPHLICVGLVVLGMLMAIGKWAFFPYMFNIQTDTLVLNLAWATFSLIILLAAISVARETRQARQDIRIPVSLPVTAYLASGHVVPARTIDISMGGAALSLPEELPVKDRTVRDITLSMGNEVLCIPVETMRTSGTNTYVRFEKLDMLAGRHLVRAVMGRADAWQPATKRESVTGLRSLADIIVVDIVTLKRMLGLNFAERRVMRRAEGTTPAAQAPADTKAKARKSGRGAALAKAAAIAIALGLGTAGILISTAQVHAATRPATGKASAIPANDGAPASAGESAGNSLRLTFKDLRVTSPIRLLGTQGEMGIPFGMRQDRVVTKATLTLQMAWSPAMLDDLSQLVVMLNGEIVQTLPLTRANAKGQELQIPVNPALFLPGDNQLNLRLIGHYARDCEDPFHSSLWANVSNTRSWLDVSYAALPYTPDLARLPLPFYDKGENLPLAMPFVFASQPHKGELEAAAASASWLGSLASYRGFAFKPVVGALPRGNAIVFLKSGQAIPGLALGAPTGPSAAVVRNPVDPAGTLLVLMGRNDGELRLAASAVALGKGVFGGARMSFDGVRIPVWSRYSALRWVSTTRPVKLGDIMEPYEMQGMGIRPGPLSVRFRVAPDLFFWPRQGGRLNLGYRYPVAKWMDRRASRLDVSINGQYLKTLGLGGDWWDGLFGHASAKSHDSKASVVLPRYNLFGQNQLALDYNMIIADKKKCTGTLPDNVRTSIDPDSTIDLTSAYHAIMMPDLATFASAGFPFTVSPDLSQTTVIISPTPSLASVEAFLDLMGRFGDSTGVPVTAVTVTSSVDPDALENQDVLVVGSSALAGDEDLFGRSPLRYENGHLTVSERSALQNLGALFGGTERDDPMAAEPLVYNARGFSGIVSFRSPFSSDRTVVAVLADGGSALPDLVDGMTDAKINAQIQGDLSVTKGDGMASFALGERYWVGSLPIWMKIAYWVSQRPMLLGLFALVLAVVLAGPAYLYFRGHAQRRLASQDDHA
ncbi:UDP-forming cellulose synthase catalytic subunit [Novosphingobium sp. 1949]|uniref:Cellulose synthase catalytic subunit [UDP-forming] n=1 Tax=Novosphingobium organovorum TaxID=2930092 RepID=A0ABT0BIK6_9SPHN|nr:UDP-forming cellulose synthase catalytic subunit [Novosphingobium organovorum]MCJ2184865.1 UDP-forming cellulose synthase catalytic subunit [Novosphingobium organovorum]